MSSNLLFICSHTVENLIEKSKKILLGGTILGVLLNLIAIIIFFSVLNTDVDGDIKIGIGMISTFLSFFMGTGVIILNLLKKEYFLIPFELTPQKIAE